MDKNEIFARNLEAIRKRMDKSQGEFALEMGIPKSTFRSVRLTGNTTLDTAIRISEGLNLPLDSLINDGRLAEKLDVVEFLLQSVNWFQALSSQEQEEIVLHFQKIVEVICK